MFVQHLPLADFDEWLRKHSHRSQEARERLRLFLNEHWSYLSKFTSEHRRKAVENAAHAFRAAYQASEYYRAMCPDVHSALRRVLDELSQ